MKPRALLPALLALSYSCSEVEPKGWLVDRMRVLGARTEALADPTRASLDPGERGTVTWLVVTPDAPPRLSWSFAACHPPEGYYANPRCTGPVLASGAGTSDGELVRMDLEMPGLAATGEVPELLVLGAFCTHGTVALDAFTFNATCSGGGEALLATTRVRLGTSGINRNPMIADDAIRLDDIPLPPAKFGVSVGPCTGGPDSPFVQAGAGTKILVRLDEAAREPAEEGREGLTLTHVVTSGELGRQYSSIEPDMAAPAQVAVELTASGPRPGEAPARLTRLFFVLRDSRGAMSFAVRSICVRP